MSFKGFRDDPSSINTMPKIRYLDLSHNQLTAIPPLSNFSQLTTLWLTDNFLSGTIPPHSSLTQLQELFLFNNTLSGPIPPSVAFLSNLRVLVLSNNRLTGQLPSLSNLTLLQDFYVDSEISFPDTNLQHNIQSRRIQRLRLNLKRGRCCRGCCSGRCHPCCLCLCGMASGPTPTICRPSSKRRPTTNGETSTHN
ncbi:L domain-like protein [Gonapodya prolifera JEL478]|uniref:L domain-like protein n=1 Tax=Gonapodya prolifera (strain JEL478) TaxID=1344416 RepID=A0A139AVN3_GONPJ|nr:L domain-like protein [Gonapodya prolifera JEL478]|eukprot:KXS20535.1 L domain-like protein [Gonapodya prolifera JEL478]